MVSDMFCPLFFPFKNSGIGRSDIDTFANTHDTLNHVRHGSRTTSRLPVAREMRVGCASTDSISSS